MKYDHYIAVDWAQSNMAIARMTVKSNAIKATDVKADVSELQIYLKSLKGTKALTIEESTASQWLYTELKDHVDELLICDPCRNKLLSEGPKNDKIDAQKLVHLLRSGLLKRVFHSGDDFIYLRKIISGYEDVIKAGVRSKNQRSALFRASHENAKKKTELKRSEDIFVLLGLDTSIAFYEEEKKRYDAEFKRLARKHKEIKHLQGIPGIGHINAVKIVARVVDPHRFERNSWWSYCGLVKLARVSGGKIYGKKNSRSCRQMKCVFKVAALTVIGGKNEFNDWYEQLITERNYPPHKARNAISRRIAALALGVLKSEEKFKPYRKYKNVKYIKTAS